MVRNSKGRNWRPLAEVRSDTLKLMYVNLYWGLVNVMAEKSIGFIIAVGKK